MAIDYCLLTTEYRLSCDLFFTTGSVLPGRVFFGNKVTVTKLSSFFSFFSTMTFENIGEMFGRNGARNACVTLWKWDEPLEKLIEDSDVIKYAVWQHEKCPETGKDHVHVYVEVNKVMKLGGWKKFVEEFTGDASAHIEKRMGTRDQARNYCMKEETRVKGPYEFGKYAEVGQGARTDIVSSLRVTLARIDEIGVDELRKEDPAMYITHERQIRRYLEMQKADAIREKKKRKMEAQELKPWQRRVVDEVLRQVENENDRSIIWVYEPNGNVGKSYLLTYLRLFHGAIALAGKADAGKMLYNGEPIAVINLTRSAQDFCGSLYGFAEDLKDGEFMSSKYMPVFKDFDPPVVVFCANFMYPEDKWSRDRIFFVDAGL